MNIVKLESFLIYIFLKKLIFNRRLQNRESASRVRNRKRTQMEQVEDEIQELKKRNEDLMLFNASLTAENNMLKQQISFLQKIVLKNSPNENNEDVLQSPQYLLPIRNGLNEEHEGKQVRLPSPFSGHKHLGVLCVLTIMLFVLGNSRQDNQNQGVLGFSEQFRNQFDRSIKSLNGNADENNVFLSKMFEFLMEQYETLCLVYSCLKYGIILIYVVYLLWFVYNFVVKKYVKLKIKII